MVSSAAVIVSVIRVPKSIRDFGGWGAVAIEIAIVTVGILVAFSLNSWWEGRQQRALEIVHLKALHQEFAENRQRLRDKEEFEKRLNERLLALIGLMRANPPPTHLELMRAFALIFTSQQFEPITAAYDTMISTGGLSVIGDAELRRSIVEVATLLKSRHEDEFADNAHRALTEAAVGKLGVLQWDALRAPSVEAASARAAQWNPEPLLADAKFQERLFWRQLQAQDLWGHYGRLGKKADELLQRLAPFAAE
jgi:hypothetical protein